MQKFLGFTLEELENNGGLNTAVEISGQPELWMKTYELVKSKENEIKDFLGKILLKNCPEIILTGAGSSAFIGNVLEGPLYKNMNISTRAVATTDLVTHPANYFHSDTPTLMISFARSGNSPESVAAIRLANESLSDISHLVITCNPTGHIVAEINKEKDLLIILQPESNDQGLAMTGSFTSMLLAAYLISRIEDIRDLSPKVERLCEYGKKILNSYTQDIFKIAQINFKRAIFLGSGPLFGCAKESHLKLQELTDGGVICKYDSYLGFRHGPKAVLDNESLIIFLFSNNPYVQQYEYDLVKSIDNGICRIGVAEKIDQDFDLDLIINMSDSGGELDEELLSICSVLPGQILGFYKSLLFGLKPDSPSVKGTITRVVEGVKIYPFTGYVKDTHLTG